MARVAIIAAALVRLVWREIRSFGSVAGNNFFLVLLLITYQQAESSAFMFVLLGLTLLFPLGSDALSRIPPERLALWPLTAAARLSLRVFSLLLNPLVWIAAGIWAGTGRVALGLEFLGILIAGQAIALAVERFVSRHPQRSLLRAIPAGSGWLRGLVAKDVRQILTTLDPYPVVLLSAATFIYRIAGTAPNASAYSVISVLIAVGLSTYAQSLFGLDGESGLTRYRLMPLSGWKILFAKGAAVLSVLFVLVLPLRPDIGMAAGLVALAIGHHSSVLRPVFQRKWRFTSGLMPIGILQLIAMAAIGAAIRTTPLWLLFAAAIYGASLILYGKVWDGRIRTRAQ